MLGCCYYPEHWPKDLWAQDAAEMAALGLTYVRIGEFAWSRFEPQQGRYDFAWFDEVIEILGQAGLKVIIGTPTATPPKWLIDAHPDILPVDTHTGHVRGFGSRRHYDFSSDVYLGHALRISKEMAKRYGANPYVVGWQTDNEIGCHDTTLSASENSKRGFQKWLQKRYGDIDALNKAWGTIFWSMEYRHFEQIELPVLAVTEAHPAHMLDWRRYSSDQVVHFHDEMVKVIRIHAKDQFVTHNFIPMDDTATDNAALGAPLDFASFDNYPLGRADLAFSHWEGADFKKYMRTGHPDLSSWHFSNVQNLSPGNFWVMEQQPGPVNWAGHNPRPAPGMIRFWTWEAFAHGAEVVSYFRWRQAPFAQEQMHAGLKRPDNSKSDAWTEVERVRAELDAIDLTDFTPEKASVALIRDDESEWVTQIERQGDSYNHFTVHLQWYSALRRLGLQVDVLSRGADLSGYKLVACPCVSIIDEDFLAQVKASKAQFLFGPRSGGKTQNFSIPNNLAPGQLQDILPLKVLSAETVRPDCAVGFAFDGQHFKTMTWMDHLDAGGADVLGRYDDGSPAYVRKGNIGYLGCLTDDEALRSIFSKLAFEVGLPTQNLSEDLRLCRRGALHFAFNYSEEPQKLSAPEGAVFLLGSHEVAGRGLAIWREDIE